VHGIVSLRAVESDARYFVFRRKKDVFHVGRLFRRKDSVMRVVFGQFLPRFSGVGQTMEKMSVAWHQALTSVLNSFT
jgi:hypothetical protein